MRVLLVSPNREQLPDPVFPIGLAYIASALKKHKHDVKVLDLCFSKDIDDDIKKAVTDFSPEIIGISLRNIDDVSYPRRHSYINEYEKTVNIIRKYVDAPIVAGGSGFTIMPDEFMLKYDFDYGIAGEGEIAFPDLLERIKTGTIRTGKIIRATKRLRNIDCIIPDRNLFDYNFYYNAGGMLNIQTKRGCQFDCIYCTYPRIEGRKMRIRSPASVAEEIEDIIKKTDAGHFFFVDSIFNYPVSHAINVCEEIIKRGLNIKWSCYANPACMTERLAEKMVKAGCTSIEFGTDSLVDISLLKLGKNFTFKEIQKSSLICRRHGIKFCHFIFLGAPGDTDDIIKINIERLHEIDPDAAVIMLGIRVFPNTRLAELAYHNGIKKIGLEPVFYISSEISDMSKYTDIISRNRRWIIPGLGINMYTRLQKRLRDHGIKGPLWEGLSDR